tara:strand:- start:640 stop:810 length:171 start_codon:yes stop_codon:yes gene_type:complete
MGLLQYKQVFMLFWQDLALYKYTALPVFFWVQHLPYLQQHFIIYEQMQIEIGLRLT